MSNQTTDVVIIGAGMAGLTAAAYLVRAGLKVQVFEQHTLPGGYVSSFAREGFTFPAGPTSFGSNGIIFPILEELGLHGKRSFARCGHQISWDGQDVPLRNPRQVRDDLAARFPGEQAGLAGYFRWVDTGVNGFRGLLESRLMFGKDIVPTLLRVGLRNPLFAWANWLARGQTNQSLHRRFFKNSRLRQMLDQLGYPVMSAKNTLGMWSNYFHDAWVPCGGMQAFANIFARSIREQGGQIHFGKRIRRILVENGQASGVQLDDGTLVPARRVVSAADLRHTCFDLIGRGQLSPTMLAKLEKARPSESIFAVFLGLGGSPQVSAALKRFQESHVWFTCADGKYIQLTLLSKDDPSLAPPGKHALFAAMLQPYADWEALKSDPAAYQARKHACAEEIIRRAEEFLPGLRQQIEVQDAASPLTYERYTSNWRAGSAGWNWDPDHAPHFDFASDLPIQNFHVVGHYVHNPGGVPSAMITAWYIAQEIIKTEASRGSEKGSADGNSFK